MTERLVRGLLVSTLLVASSSSVGEESRVTLSECRSVSGEYYSWQKPEAGTPTKEELAVILFVFNVPETSNTTQLVVQTEGVHLRLLRKDGSVILEKSVTSNIGCSGGVLRVYERVEGSGDGSSISATEATKSVNVEMNGDLRVDIERTNVVRTWLFLKKREVIRTTYTFESAKQ